MPLNPQPSAWRRVHVAGTCCWCGAREVPWCQQLLCTAELTEQLRSSQIMLPTSFHSTCHGLSVTLVQRTTIQVASRIKSALQTCCHLFLNS